MNAPVNTNPFLPTAPQNQAVATVQTESSRAVAEVQSALVIAKQFPRDMNQGKL